MDTHLLANTNSHLYAKPKPSTLATEEIEEDIEEIETETRVITLGNISWERFKTIDDGFDEIRSIRLTYLGGVLEIMAPVGSKHEDVKRTLCYLLEAYMREKGLRFYGRGSFTLEKEGISSSEPDESYCIGSYKKIPDIVIEVIITSGSLDKIGVYKPHKVPEVWFWKQKKISIFQLQAGEYQEVFRSQFLPDLELTLLQRYIDYPDQYEAVLAFQKAIRADNPS
jgi:Uma2 family endonuclease